MIFCSLASRTAWPAFPNAGWLTYRQKQRSIFDTVLLSRVKPGKCDEDGREEAEATRAKFQGSPSLATVGSPSSTLTRISGAVSFRSRSYRASGLVNFFLSVISRTLPGYFTAAAAGGAQLSPLAYVKRRCSSESKSSR